jgi:hypothetical protein
LRVQLNQGAVLKACAFQTQGLSARASTKFQ